METQTIQPTTAELYTEILSNSRHELHDKLRNRINMVSREMASVDYKSPTLERKYPKEWEEGITIRNMTDLLFWSGKVSVKQVAWLVRYAIKHNVQL